MTPSPADGGSSAALRHANAQHFLRVVRIFAGVGPLVGYVTFVIAKGLLAGIQQGDLIFVPLLSVVYAVAGLPFILPLVGAVVTGLPAALTTGILVAVLDVSGWPIQRRTATAMLIGTTAAAAWASVLPNYWLGSDVAPFLIAGTVAAFVGARLSARRASASG